MIEVVTHKYEVRLGGGDVFYVDTLEEARDYLEQEIEDSRDECDPEWPYWVSDGFALHMLDDDGNELFNERGERGIMRLKTVHYVTAKRPPPEEIGDDDYDKDGQHWPSDVDEYWDFKVEDCYNGPKAETGDAA